MYDANGKGKLCIPAIIRIGVTGHRTLSNEQFLHESVRKVLDKVDKILSQTPHTFVAVSPLAEGADRLAAKEIMEWQESDDETSLEVVLPLPKEYYIKDFETQESRDEFRELLAKAKSVYILEKAESRIAAYEDVGHYVVDNCDFLIAIWDGKPSEKKGGTAKIVEYALNVGKHVFWINSNDGKIEEKM